MNAPQERQFRLQVDAAHCERAAQGLRLMAQRQYRSVALRYANARWLKRLQRSGRKVAPVLGALCFLLGLVMSVAAGVDASARTVYAVLATAFFLEAFAFWLLPKRADAMAAGVRTRFERIFGNWAAARLDKARRAAPFEAVYDLRGDQLTYSRIERDQWRQLWNRDLRKLRPRGVAMQAPGVVAIFPKPGAVMPAMLILVADDGALAAAMRALGWTIAEIDPATGEPRAQDDAQ